MLQPNVGRAPEQVRFGADVTPSANTDSTAAAQPNFPENRHTDDTCHTDGVSVAGGDPIGHNDANPDLGTDGHACRHIDHGGISHSHRDTDIRPKCDGYA